MESFFASDFDKVSGRLIRLQGIVRGSGKGILVGADTGSFECLRRKLLVLVRHHMDAQRELIHIGTLATQIEDTDFWVGDTTVEA